MTVKLSLVASAIAKCYTTIGVERRTNDSRHETGPAAISEFQQSYYFVPTRASASALAIGVGIMLLT